MKLTLRQIYGKDRKLVTEGFEYKIPNSNVVFKLRQYDSILNEQLTKEAANKEFRPYSKKLEDGSLSSEKQLEIAVRVFVTVSLVSWSGVVDDNGQDIPFTVDNAVKILCEYEDLFKELIRQAKDSRNYLESMGND